MGNTLSSSRHHHHHHHHNHHNNHLSPSDSSQTPSRSTRLRNKRNNNNNAPNNNRRKRDRPPSNHHHFPIPIPSIPSIPHPRRASRDQHQHQQTPSRTSTSLTNVTNQQQQSTSQTTTPTQQHQRRHSPHHSFTAPENNANNIPNQSTGHTNTNTNNENDINYPTRHPPPPQQSSSSQPSQQQQQSRHQGNTTTPTPTMPTNSPLPTSPLGQPPHSHHSATPSAPSSPTPPPYHQHHHLNDITQRTTFPSSTATNNTTNIPTPQLVPPHLVNNPHHLPYHHHSPPPPPPHLHSSVATANALPNNVNNIPPGLMPIRYGRPDKLGLDRKEFINVHRKGYTGRIELLQGSVEGLSKADETDLLIVYLRERGVYKANRDSSLAALNRSGISLPALEKESKPQPSYRRHYHCWLSRPIPKPRPEGFEYKRLLVYEDPGEELTKDDNIVLDIVKCLTTVIGGDVQIQSVLIPLSGALLSPSLRKHFVKVTVEVAFAWMRMGLPLKTVKILLPDGDITKDIETFRKANDILLRSAVAPPLRHATNDVYFSYAQADKEAAREMIAYLTSKNPSIHIYEAESRDISVRKRGVVDNSIMEAVSASRIFLALLSDDYFHSVECTEAFSLAYCRDFESQGNFIIPLFWRSCDLTPLARRLVATEGVDCREASFNRACTLLDEILSALATMGGNHNNPNKNYHGQNNHVDAYGNHVGNVGATTNVGGGVGGTSNMAAAQGDELFEGAGAGSGVGADDDRRLRIAEKLLMKKDGTENNELFEELAEHEEQEETVSKMFFDKKWRETWAIDFKEIVFGPRIGAGGFGEVYKCKYDQKMVAVKTLQKIEDDDPQALMAEFMVEMKLMSKLRHPNIVEFIGACIHNPNLAIILEFMAGGSLYRAIHRRRRNVLGPFPLLKTVWIAYGVAKGMQHLHCQYPVVIHRDVKSPNVLLGTNVREVKITDFGLSRLRVNSYVNTGPGGTPEWMAPELLRQDPFNEKSDVFSFGVILWELVMCEKPWRDDHPMQIVFKVGSRGEKLPTPPPECCEPELREMIVECFADDPTRRPDFKTIVEKLDVMCHRVDS